MGVTIQEFHNGLTFCSLSPQLVYVFQPRNLPVLGYKGEISYHELGISPFCLFVSCFFFLLSHRVVQY